LRIADVYSHLNGEEWLTVHAAAEYAEIRQVIGEIDAERCRLKVSKEERMVGRLLFSPRALNREFKARLDSLGWRSSRVAYHLARTHHQMQVMQAMPAPEQREFLIREGIEPMRSYNQTDHVKGGVAVEVQFGKYSFVAYDLFVKHLAFYSERRINVGVEILPMKAMQQEMSSGVAYFEGELYNLIRHGRNNPPVPLVILGLAP
jgi:hypothetical protein